MDKMNNLSVLPSIAMEMLMKHKHCHFINSSQTSKNTFNYIHKNYRPQPCLPCDYLEAK